MKDKSQGEPQPLRVIPRCVAAKSSTVSHSFRKTVVTSFAATAILACLLLAQACSSHTVSQTRALPFALCTLTVYDHASDATFTACFDRIEAVLQKFNMYSADSEISRVNKAAGTGAVPVSDDFLAALREGLELSNDANGLFDPTVGPLVKLWKIGSDEAHVPDPKDIRAALQLVGWRNILVDEQAKTVALRRPGVTLDFGALLKGFAAVEVGRVMHSRGVGSAIVDIGGSVLALGSKPGGVPWRIGVQKPGAPIGVSLGEIQVRDEVVNTSGAYEQFFRQNGQRYQHIMDPRTGYPVDNGVESVTVIAGGCATRMAPACRSLRRE